MSTPIGTAKFVSQAKDLYKPVVATITVVLRERSNSQSPANQYLKSVADAIVDTLEGLQSGDESTGDDVLVPDMDIVRANVEVKFQ